MYIITYIRKDYFCEFRLIKKIKSEYRKCWKAFCFFKDHIMPKRWTKTNKEI